MRCGIAAVLFLVITISCFQDHQIMAGRRSPGRPSGQERPPGLKGEPDCLPYCPVDKETAEFLASITQKSTIPSRRKGEGEKTVRSKGEKGEQGPTIHIPDFPIDCRHAALNFGKGIYNMDIFKCCTNCEHPDFTDCLSQNRNPLHIVYFVCPSNAIHCISKCLCKKKGGGKPGRPGLILPPCSPDQPNYRPVPPCRQGPPGRPGPPCRRDPRGKRGSPGIRAPPGPRAVEPRCRETIGFHQGSQCIKRSCIPIKG